MSTSFTGPVLYSGGPNNADASRRGLSIGVNTDQVIYFNDFLDESDIDITSNYTSTETEGGAGDTVISVLAGSRNGILSIVNDAADNDLTSLQQKNEIWKLTAGKVTYFETLLSISVPAEADFFIGLAITDTSPLDATDFLGFNLTDASAVLLCKTTKNSTETSTSSGISAVTLTNIKLAMYCNGVGSVEFYINDNKVATHTTNICDDEELCFTIHSQNGEAVAKTVLIDYILIAADR